MEVMEGIGAVTKVLGDLWNVGYGTYQDQRDTNYQRDLQQKIFDREDNAVQRRMADLQAAGLNPNLAAGSSAGAGSVVGRSNAQNVNYDSGSMIDALSAVSQLKLQKAEADKLKAETENAQKEWYILDEKQEDMHYQKLLNQAYTYSMLGIPYNVQSGIISYLGDKKGYVNDGWWLSTSRHGVDDLNQGQGQNLIDYNTYMSAKQQSYQTELLQKQLEMAIKQNDWYTVNQILNIANTATQSFSNVTNPFKGFLKPSFKR